MCSDLRMSDGKEHLCWELKNTAEVAADPWFLVLTAPSEPLAPGSFEVRENTRMPVESDNLGC